MVIESDYEISIPSIMIGELSLGSLLGTGALSAMTTVEQTNDLLAN